MDSIYTLSDMRLLKKRTFQTFLHLSLNQIYSVSAVKVSLVYSTLCLLIQKQISYAHLILPRLILHLV